MMKYKYRNVLNVNVNRKKNEMVSSDYEAIKLRRVRERPWLNAYSSYS